MMKPFVWGCEEGIYQFWQALSLHLLVGAPCDGYSTDVALVVSDGFLQALFAWEVVVYGGVEVVVANFLDHIFGAVCHD